MRKLLPFFIISIFLCAAYSTDAQDWESLAVEYERVVFEGAGLEEVNSAIIAKADCYKRLGRYSEAFDCLSRVRMFALLPSEQQDVLYQQQLCAFLAGDFTTAASLVDEVTACSEQTILLDALSLAYAGDYERSELYSALYLGFKGLDSAPAHEFFKSAPQKKKAATAMALSFLPPAGHIYVGRPGEGMLSMLLNAMAAGFTVANILSGYWVTGILGGGIALDHTFMGNQERTARLVEEYNNNSAVVFGDSLRKFLSEY